MSNFTFKGKEVSEPVYTIRPYESIPFGKYKGENAADIAEQDPRYILWLAKETQHTVCSSLVDLARDIDDECEADWDYYDDVREW